MTTNLAPLFQGYELNGVKLENRLAVAPMTRISATEDGLATEAMTRYYERFAQGGFGLVITEGLYTDQRFSQGYAFQPGISDEAQAKSWRPIVDAVHAAGGKIVAQLMHAGALSQANRFSEVAAGPSAIQPKGKQMALYRGDGPYSVPRAMTEADIHEVIAGFSGAASRAIGLAGFDAVEIHGANGYLLDQFFTDYSNERDDAWGGTIGQRIRLSAEVLKAVRATLGHSIPVGLRLSQGKVNDFTHQWQEAEAGAKVVFEQLSTLGLDYIHLTEFEAWRPAFNDDGPSLVKLARKYSTGSTTVIANGSLHDPVRALDSLSDGADIIALGRGALSNPNWPNRVRTKNALQAFDADLLSPLGNLKASELTPVE
nr:NADH:flavin oxidoreductase [uncultured Ralstonia sp.]